MIVFFNVITISFRITIHKNGSLTLKAITKRDEGFYSCVGFRNGENTQLQRFSAKLKIACKLISS